MIAKAAVCNSLILEVEDCTKVSAARMAFVVSEFICVKSRGDVVFGDSLCLIKLIF